MKLMLEGYKCERCGHEWVKRSTTEGDPVICPKCKSPYWNKPRRSEVPTNVAEAMKEAKSGRRRKGA